MLEVASFSKYSVCTNKKSNTVLVSTFTCSPVPHRYEFLAHLDLQLANTYLAASDIFGKLIQKWVLQDGHLAKLHEIRSHTI